MPFTASGRVAPFGTSIFTEMSALAARHGAINLGQGFPDFPAPDFVKDAAIRHIREDRNQYAASAGVPRLRAAIARRWRERLGRPIDAETEITVASGATEVLFDACAGLINPGDEVVVFEPFYDAYLPDVLMAGGAPRVVRLHPPDWHFDAGELRAAFTRRTRALILNTPHNPTGKVFTPQDLDIIAGLCREHDVMVISDEVYAEIVYGAARHVSIASLPGMWERTLTIDSMGKTFSVTGWKVGWAVGPAVLSQAVRAAHQFVTFTNSVPFQEALADALDAADAIGFYPILRAEYAARRELLAAALTAAGIPPLPIDGAYFLMADISRTGFSDDVSFCRHLASEIGVAAIPPSAFYVRPSMAPLLARFCFAKKDETIRAAAGRLEKLLRRR